MQKKNLCNFRTEEYPCYVLMNHSPVNEDLVVCKMGMTKYAPSFQEALCRNVYVLHFVASGKCKLQGRTVRAGDAYLMAPNVQHFFTADAQDPPTIYWIIFKGSKAEQVLKTCSIKAVTNIFQNESNYNICELIHKKIFEEFDGVDIEYSILSFFFKIVSLLKNKSNINKSTDKGAILVETAKGYIKQNYNRINNIHEISDFVNITQNHLCKLFKQHTNGSLQNYLTNCRINTAKSLLKQSSVSISDIAVMTGFEDPTYFSQVFKKEVGCSPKQFRTQK